MAKAGDVLDLGPLGAVFRVKRTSEETEGGSFEMEWELAPRTGGTPVHVHPEAVEIYEVLSGELDLQIEGKWRTLRAGEKAQVEKGVPHTFRNASDATTRVYNTHEPALAFDAYFEGLARLVERNILHSATPSPKAMLHLAMHMTNFPREIRSVKPPHGVLRVMAKVGRALGYQV